jgi:hypothetical protein
MPSSPDTDDEKENINAPFLNRRIISNNQPQPAEGLS